jgi:hypothetical protein
MATIINSTKDPKTIYLPLNENRNEIRLIAFEEPPEGSCLIHCALETVSLDDIRDNHKAYLASPNAQGKSQRKAISLWANRQNPVRHETDLGSDHVPPVDAYRYLWGDYVALSYVWGSEAKGRDIVLNGRKTTITKNLEIALQAISRTKYHVGRYRLWVDALCINQEDEDERASQVKKMREVYSGAWSVIAWLGQEYDKSDKAFDLLQQLASLAAESRTLGFGQLHLDTELFDGSSFYGLSELINRAYWSRLWIVQELVLGASASILRCGNRLMSWPTFCTGIEVLFRSDLWVIKDSLLMDELQRRGLEGREWNAMRLHLLHQDLRILSQYEEEATGRLGFRRLLDIACLSDCRDTRDKVFALVGMMEPDIAETLSHVYSVSDASVFFANVARAFIQYFDNLEPLRDGNPWGPTGAPSWAADWTWNGRMRYSRPESPLRGEWQNVQDTEPSPERIYTASGRRPPRYNFSETLLLTCQGFVFDSIAGLGATEHGYFCWNQKTMVQFPMWRSAYGGKDETAGAISRALLLGRISGARPAEKRHAAILNLPKTFDRAYTQFRDRSWAFLASQEGYYFRWERWRQAHSRFRLGNMLFEDYFSDDIPLEAQERDYTEVYGAVDRAIKGRRLMLTTNGYLGWVPDNAFGWDGNQTEPGDLICIIFGCSVPLAIRPMNERFLVIGEAYVEGFMSGEALELIESVKSEVKDFTFC